MATHTKSQAALEFLTTYGWAFLVILIMIGTLAYFGILSPSKLLPSRCNLGQEFQCLDYQISATGNSIKLRLKNNAGVPITIASVIVSSESVIPLTCTSTPADYTSQLWGGSYWSQLGLISFNAPLVNNGVKTDSTFHTDSSGPGSFLWLGLDAGNAKAFTRVDISITYSSVVAIWDIQYSDDNSVWSTAYSGANVGLLPAWGTGSYSWSSVGPHRYWRLYKTNPAGGGSYHGEVQFYEGDPSSLSTWKSGDSIDLQWSGCNHASAGLVSGEKGKVLIKIQYYPVSSGAGFAREVNGEIYSAVV